MEILVILLLLFCLCLLENFREIHTFCTKHYEVVSDKLSHLKNETKIIFLSDLHNCQYGENNDKLFETIQNEKPDMILIAGDMLVGKKNISSAVAENLVSRLTSVCPVYYANGNHEQRMKEDEKTYGLKYLEYKHKLSECGVIFLENEHQIMSEFNMAIYGLEIPKHLYKKGKKQDYELQDMLSKLKKPQEKMFNILLAHNPIYMNTYLEWKPDLVLSGHLHGGMIRLPLIGGMITPQFGLFPKYSGEYRKKGSTSVIVSKGLGTHTFKVRLFNPAEMVVIHLKNRS